MARWAVSLGTTWPAHPCSASLAHNSNWASPARHYNIMGRPTCQTRRHGPLDTSKSTGSLTTRHWEDKFFCTIHKIKWFKFPHGFILHSKNFPTSIHTPKSELKRRSYDPDKLEKKNKLLSRNCRDQVSCHDQET